MILYFRMRIPPPDCLCGYLGFRKFLMMAWIRVLTWDSITWRALYLVNMRNLKKRR